MTANSNSITVAVSNSSVPAVSIIASSINICNSQPVTFTATPFNGGPSPSYQWKKNGIVVGLNSSTFTSSSFLPGDVIQVSMSSNALCSNPAMVSSNTITLVSANVLPTVIINGETMVAQGTNVVVNTIITNGGTSPAYLWQDSTETHFWQNIPNQVNPVLNYTPASTGDKIRAILTSSAACASPTLVTSNVINFTVARPLPAERVITYPNPATSYVILDSLSTIDEWSTLTVLSLGGKIYFTQNITGQNKVTIPVGSLLPGMYILRLNRNVGYPLYKRFIKI